MGSWLPRANMWLSAKMSGLGYFRVNSYWTNRMVDGWTSLPNKINSRWAVGGAACIIARLYPAKITKRFDRFLTVAITAQFVNMYNQCVQQQAIPLSCECRQFSFHTSNSCFTFDVLFIYKCTSVSCLILPYEKEPARPITIALHL